MHPLRETIKISGERERGQEAAMMAAAARSFAIRDSAYATSSRVRNPDLERRSSVRFPFRNTCVLFDSRRILSLPSFAHPFSLFFDHLSFHFQHPCHFSFLACPCFHPLLPLLSLPFVLWFSIFVLDSTGAHSRHARKISKRRIRGRRATHRHIQPPFCVHYGYLQPGRKGPVYARTCERKAFRKSARRWRGGSGESENLRAIAIRARVHCAKFRRKRERERSITR